MPRWNFRMPVWQPMTEDRVLPRSINIIGSANNAMAATYIAALVGVISVLGDAKDYPELKVLLSNISVPLMVGVILSVLTYAGHQGYLADLEHNRRTTNDFFPLSMRYRLMLSFTLLMCLSALISLFLVLIRFQNYLGALAP